MNWQAEPALREAARIVQRLGAKKCAERAARILDWLGLDAAERGEHWQHWCEEFLTKEGKPRAASGFVIQGGDATRIPIWRGASSTNATASSPRSTPAWRCAWPRSRPRC